MKRIFLLLLFILAVRSSYADLLESYSKLNTSGYNYWLYTPNLINPEGDSVSTTKPLIVFLHGQSLCGKDLNRVLRYGPIDAIRRGKRIDSYIISPQNPGGAWNPRKVFEIVDWACGNFKIDTCRIYVIGMSLGGFGTIGAVSAYPDRIAAAMALCGGGNNPDYEALNKVPLWIMHGTADKAVKDKQSEEIVKGIKKAGDGNRLLFTKLKGQSHGALAKIFYLEQTYQWLFAHSLEDSTRTLNKEYSIDVKDMSRAYADLSSVQKSSLKVIENHKKSVKDSENKKKSATDKVKPIDNSEEVSTDVEYHVVKRGDTLYSLARRYKTTIARLCELNDMEENSILQLDRKLRIK